MTQPSPGRVDVPAAARAARLARRGEGGPATVALGYIRDQVERGWNVSVACSSRGFLGYDAREAGADTHWWQAEREPGRRVVGEVVRLTRIIAETDPDVVHLHSPKAGLAGRLALRNRVPTVFQPHAWSYFAATGGVRAAIAAVGAVRDPLDRPHRVRERGRAGRRAAGSGSRAAPWWSATGSRSTTFRPQGDRDRAGARELLGLPDVPTALCVGELTAQKGQRGPARRLAGRAGAGPRRTAGDRRRRPGPTRPARQAAELPGVQPGRRSQRRPRLAGRGRRRRRARRGGTGCRWCRSRRWPARAAWWPPSVAGVVESVPDDAGAIVAPGRPRAPWRPRSRQAASSTRDWPEDEGWAGRAPRRGAPRRRDLRARAGPRLPAPGGGAPVALTESRRGDLITGVPTGEYR